MKTSIKNSMKHSRWIYMICAMALFSAHQTHRKDADKPDYSRSPAMVRPIEAPKPSLSKAKARSKSFKEKLGFHKSNNAAF